MTWSSGIDCLFKKLFRLATTETLHYAPLVKGIHRWRVHYPHKYGKCFNAMASSCNDDVSFSVGFKYIFRLSLSDKMLTGEKRRIVMCGIMRKQIFLFETFWTIYFTCTVNDEWRMNFTINIWIGIWFQANWQHDVIFALRSLNKWRVN